MCGSTLTISFLGHLLNTKWHCGQELCHNEELYGILSGSGYAVIDGEKITLKQGDWLHIAPAGKRQFFADNDSALTYVCIQTKAGSLEGYTATDAIIEQ